MWYRYSASAAFAPTCPSVSPARRRFMVTTRIRLSVDGLPWIIVFSSKRLLDASSPKLKPSRTRGEQRQGLLAVTREPAQEIGRAHAGTPVTGKSRSPSPPGKKKMSYGYYHN